MNRARVQTSHARAHMHAHNTHDRSNERMQNEKEAVDVLCQVAKKKHISEIPKEIEHFLESLSYVPGEHELVQFMDSATMYSRAKEAREFHHNFVCFQWINLGLPLDWLALIPGALMEGDDSLENMSRHTRGLWLKQLKALHSKKGLSLSDDEVARVVMQIGDGKEIREATGHKPGKHWHKVTPYSSAEKDFLFRQRGEGDPRLVGVATTTHTKSFFLKLKNYYQTVLEQSTKKK